MWIGHMIHAKINAKICDSAWAGKLCLLIPTLTISNISLKFRSCGAIYAHMLAYSFLVLKHQLVFQTPFYKQINALWHCQFAE